MLKLKFNAEALCVSLLVAAEMLSISTGLCYRLVHEGQIPSIRLGRRILIPLAALNEMCEGERKGGRVCRDANEKPPTETAPSSAAGTEGGEPLSG